MPLSQQIGNPDLATCGANQSRSDQLPHQPGHDFASGADVTSHLLLGHLQHAIRRGVVQDETARRCLW